MSQPEDKEIRRLVDAHFAGHSSAKEDRRLMGVLRTDSKARARYRQQALLEALEPDAAARVQLRMGRALSIGRRSRAPSWILPGLATLAVAASLVMLFRPAPQARFAARGGAIPNDGTAGGPTLLIFQSPATGPIKPAGARMAQAEGLAFAYSCPSTLNATHLLIFAQDSAGRIYWYWPAWKNLADDPGALGLTCNGEQIELPEVIRHDLTPGRLRIHGVFARRPYQVKHLETLIANGRLDTLDATVTTHDLVVSP